MVVRKTKHHETKYSTLNVNNRNVKGTKQFKYPGSIPILSEKNEIEREITARIQRGNKCLRCRSCAKLLGSIDVKIQLYVTLTRRVNYTAVKKKWVKGDF